MPFKDTQSAVDAWMCLHICVVHGFRHEGQNFFSSFFYKIKTCAKRINRLLFTFGKDSWFSISVLTCWHPAAVENHLSRQVTCA